MYDYNYWLRSSRAYRAMFVITGVTSVWIGLGWVGFE